MSELTTSRVNGLLGVEYEGERIVNLCPHPIQIISPWNSSEIITLPQSGNIARKDKRPDDIEKHAGFPIVREIYGEIYGLPDEEEGTLYVVSAPVLSVLNDSRKDVVALGKQIKDQLGKSVSALSFRRRF